MTQFESHPGLKNRDRKRRECQKGVGSLKRSVSRAPAALVIIGLGHSAPATRITDLMVDFSDYILIILEISCHYDDGGNAIETEQITLVLGPNFLASFQEREGDVFCPIYSSYFYYGYLWNEF
jgi:hypothetical protein